jgi:hypothetical protein
VLTRDGLELRFTGLQKDAEVDDALFRRPECPIAPEEPLFFKKRARVRGDPGAMEDCAGRYRLPGAHRGLLFTHQRGHLLMRAEGGPLAVEVFPMSDSTYFREFENFELHFAKDSTGSVGRLNLVVGDRTVQYHRVEGPPPRSEGRESR